MKNFLVNGNLGRFNINLPESLEEISLEYLNSCTTFVHPAPNYALVGIVYKDSLSLILTASKKTRPTNVSIIPIFIKAGQSDSDFINDLKLGDKIVIAGSDLSLGHDIKSPYNKITPDNVVSLCEGDKEIYKDALGMNKPVCFLGFKLVPVNAIHGKLDKTANSFENPYINKARITVYDA